MSHQWPSSALSRIRSTTYINVALNLASVIIGGFAASVAVADKCSGRLSTATALVCGGGGVALLWLLGAGWAQASAAAAVVGRTASGPNEVEHTSDRKLRRKRYNRWLAWARSGFLVTALQTVLAAFLSYQLARAFHTDSLDSSGCPSPPETGHNASLLPLTLILTISAWLAAILPCVMGHDVLNWRSLYEMQDMAWRAHYHEVFDRNIRQAMCCLGRIRYWKASEDDEINAVAALTADILAYRAQGATHLDLLAGLNLMRAKTPEQYNFENLSQPPAVVLQEAAFLQPFAVAAYTGPVLDMGRNPFLFCCTWTYRQGVLTPWHKSRYPVLEGDNMIRGHAAAFLRYIRLPPECLRKGRVKQKRHWEAAYFVVVVPEHRCVIVAVRGTETPEDVLTDALGREVELGEHDLGGLSPAWSNQDLAQEHKPPSGQKRFAHKGVVIAARELAYQLDGMPYDDDVHAPHRDSLGGESEPGAERGLLSELLGPGGECEGYSLRFVGHSLGGGISTVTALRLRPRFPQVHVFAFNTIPSLDQETADACSKFVTSVIYNNDWASRISVASVMRLRAAALRAQAAETARQASEDTGKRSGPSLPAPVSEKSPASGNGNGHANGDGRLGAEPRRMDSNMGLEHLGIWAIRKGGPAGRGRRRFRHVAGVGCLCAHLTSCVCHMATDKDTTKGRGVIRSAREMHKAGLDIRGEIRKSLEVPRGPEGLANLAEVGTEMERGIKGGGSETEGREKAANGTGHGSISGDAVRNPDTRTVSEKAAGKENGSSHRRPLSYDGEKGKVDKREPSPAISSAKLDPILRTGESKARLGRHFTAEPEPLERGNVGSGRSDPRGVASSNLSRVGSSENGVEEAGQSERSSNGIDGGADADGVAQAAANPGGVGDNPKINGVELEKEPVQIGRPSSVELAASSASKSGGVRTEFTSPLSGGSVDADQVEGRFEGEPGLPIRANDPNPGPTADAQSRRLDAGPSSRLLAAPSSDAVVIEVSQLERKPQTRADYDLTPDVKSRSGEPEPPDGEFVGPSDEHRDRTSEEGINEEIGSNHMDDSAYPRELFVPGTIVHVIRVEEGGYWPTPRFGQWRHRAVLVDRSSLRELPIHASMFLDHLPWRLQGALNELLEIAKLEPPPFGLRLPSWFKKTSKGDSANQTCLPVGPAP